MKNLEEQINTGFSLNIFRGYTAINKRVVEKIIDELYATLPDDVKIARQYLKERNVECKTRQNPEVYDKVKTLEDYIEKAFPIAQLVIVNIREIEEIIDNVYANIPKEITTARILEKEDHM